MIDSPPRIVIFCIQWTEEARHNALTIHHDTSCLIREYKKVFGQPPMRIVERLVGPPSAGALMPLDEVACLAGDDE